MLQGDHLKNKHARVVILVNATSSECVLQMYEVSLKYLLRLSSNRADTILCWTDGRTDRRKTICLPTLPGGDIIVNFPFFD